MTKRGIALMLALLLLLPWSGTALADGRPLGDCSGDGEVNAHDAALILRYTVDLGQLGSEAWYAADVSGDGKVSAADAALILRCTVRLSVITGEVGQLMDMIDGLSFSLDSFDLTVGETATLYVLTAGSGETDLSLSCDAPGVLSAVLNGTSISLQALSIGAATLRVEDAVSHYSAKITIAVLSPISPPAVNTQLYEYICIGLYGTSSVTEAQANTALALYQSLCLLSDADPYRKVLEAGLSYVGTPYSQLDCSAFTRQAYRDCGYGSGVVCAGSNDQISLFRKNGVLYDIPTVGGVPYYSGVRPGSVLLWTNSAGTGNHSALYFGSVNGTDYYLESSSGNGGVRLCAAWGSYGSWILRYYALPLG